jgi:hypothetical protein
VNQADRTGCRSTAASAPVVIFAFAIALAACGSTQSAQTPVQPPASFAISPAHTSTRSRSSASYPVAHATAQVSHPRRSHIDAIVSAAKATYHNETNGSKLFQQLGRIARDGILLNALSRGDLTGAQAEASAQLRSPVNHLAHVTRISVIRGSRVLVNATVNSDGVFVVAPGTRILRSHGRVLGTLLVSLQDVTGFVKLVHRRTGAEVFVRGGSGHVRTSLGAAASIRPPRSGHVTISGRGYFVRSFPEVGWGNEPLVVWILERA